jgi:glycerol-3-phosphate dehydrogenase
LIHGGLRYLETYDFRLVRSALGEREILLRMAPHIIWPLRFVLPHHEALRPQWLIRAGLFLYDHIGGRKLLPPSRRVNLREHPVAATLKPGFQTGFEYSDCWAQDSRLVVLNAIDAQARGAEIKTRTSCIDLKRNCDHWIAKLRNEISGECYQVKARAVVNAAGPWVEKVFRLGGDKQSAIKLRLVKGSHIVVPKLFDHGYPFIFQNADGRVMFAVPFEEDFTLLGTTDQEVVGDFHSAEIDDTEITQICESVNEYFDKSVSPSDAVWTYSGVRALHDNAVSSASKVTRDYTLHLDTGAAPMLSVIGGKLTTFRRLAQDVMRLLGKSLQVHSPNWTAHSHLPGGDIENADFEEFLRTCKLSYPWLPPALLYNYARNYGTRITVLLTGCCDMGSLGRHFGGPLYEREVLYLMQNEFAMTGEDVLWRRSKKGLFVSIDVAAEVDRWMALRIIRSNVQVDSSRLNSAGLANDIDDKSK